MNKIIYITALITLLYSSCTKDDLNTEVDNDFVVVEAYLESDKLVSVQLTKMIPYSDEEYTGSLTVDTAIVFVKNNGIDYLLAPVENEPGQYKSIDTSFKAIEGDSYYLSFEYNGEIVSSNTIIPLKPVGAELSITQLYFEFGTPGGGSMPEPVTVSWENPEDLYHLVIVEYLESTYAPINENLDSTTFDQHVKVSSEPIKGTSYNLNIMRNLMFFGNYKIMVYRINEEYVNLYENVNQSSLNLTEPLTNIENGLGLFTGVSSVSLDFELIKIE